MENSKNSDEVDLLELFLNGINTYKGKFLAYCSVFLHRYCV